VNPPAALLTWLADAVPGAGPVTVDALPGIGMSNELLLVRRADAEWVLRRPRGAHLADRRSRTMVREFRFLRALDGTTLPHPRALALCEDEQASEAACYVMEKVDGFTPVDPLPAAFDDPAVARGFAETLVDRLADLAGVDWAGRGLADLGRPDGYLARQVDRWEAQVAGYGHRTLDAVPRLAAWLRDHLPAAGPVGIVHGDYQPTNTIFDRTDPTTMVAIVDWELATIGDPLLDLGWLAAAWAEPGDDAPRPLARVLRPRPGFPDRATLVARYAARTGFDVSAVDFYSVLALYRMACSIEGFYAEHVAGTGGDPRHEMFGAVVLEMLGVAEQLAREAG
jgi:aminoglycoside phosphotransferase (APT) family kinase protein